jgi:hypothetical protein
MYSEKYLYQNYGYNDNELITRNKLEHFSLQEHLDSHHGPDWKQDGKKRDTCEHCLIKNDV